ncbi:MAG: DUF6804 family protein [Bacteroidota bacterium]
MRSILLICSALLFIGVANLPMGYYTFLRIAVTFGAIMVIVREYKAMETINYWMIIFGAAAILFNPLDPIHFNKEIWIVLDIAAGILFGVKALTLKHS